MSGRTGGRDGEAGAAERRLAEALRAQASLGARTSATAEAGHAGRSGAPRRAAASGPATSPRCRSHPGQNPGGATGQPAPTSAAGQGPGRGAGAGRASPARTGASGQSGPGPQHAGPRPPEPDLGPSGRTGHSGGQHVRPRDDQLPTTKVVTAEPGAAGAPTAQQPSAQPAPARPPQPPSPHRPRRRRPAPARSWTPGCASRCSSASSGACSWVARSPCCRSSTPGCSPRSDEGRLCSRYDRSARIG